MPINKNTIVSGAAVIVIILVIAGGAVFYVRGLLRVGSGELKPDVETPTEASGAETIKSGALPEAIAEIAKYQYTEEYANAAYGFSFKHPQDFMVSEMPAEGGEVVLIQNAAKNIGVQILITAFPEGEIDISADFIKAEIPDLKITETQELLIGLNRKGLAFMSDNEAFGGASREVWFIYGGNIYQISAYAELAGFLQGLFGTWAFTE